MDGFTIGVLAKQTSDSRRAEQTQASWANYQQQMEAALFDQKVATAVQMTLKDMALAELRKVDPNNPILRQENRLKIRDEIEETARKTGKHGLE